MKVALVSLDQVWRDKLANQIQCRSVVEEIKAASSDIDLIVFPELTLTGFCVDDSALVLKVMVNSQILYVSFRS